MKAVLITTILLASLFSFADPIDEGTVDSFRAGWFVSTSKPCPLVCDAISGIAEKDVFDAPSINNKVAYNCKADVNTGGPNPWKGTLHGNNFDSNGYSKVCIVSTPAGVVIRAQKYFCLCVK